MDFYDRLKSSRRLRFARYNLAGHWESIWSNSTFWLRMTVDALSLILHRSTAQQRRTLTEKMKKLIPRQMFEVRFKRHRQQVIARETVKAMGKTDREMLCGDIHATQAARETERRQEGMKKVGRVEIPQEAFLAC